MPSLPTDHPELGGEQNPLLEALGPYIPMSGLPKALQNEPLKQIRWQSLRPGPTSPRFQ